MKLTKLMLSACVAALALVGCTKEEGPSVDGNYKSVKIEVSNLFLTKSAGDAIPAGTPVALKDFRIYLVAGNTIKNTATDNIGNTRGAEAYICNAKPSGDIEYHFVDPSVNKVVAVANLTAEQYASIKTYDDIKAIKLAIADQQNAGSLALYAEDVLEQAGEQHIPKPGEHKEGESLITNVYKATLNFAPRVSRFELDGFAVKFLAENQRYNKISINQVAFNNYYPTSVLYNGAEEGALVDCTPEDPAKAVAYLTGNTGNEWYSDKETLDFTRPAGMTADQWVKADLKSNLYYHFFATTTVPEFLFQVSTEDVDGGVSSTYIYTKNFKGSNGQYIEEFEEGKIYRMNFEGTAEGDGDVPLSEEDIDQLGRCLDITVTVENWNVVLVTPEF